MDDIVIVGIGNPFRGDDGAGWAVIDALQKKLHAIIQLRKLRGDIGELLDLFARYSTIYLIDACQIDKAPIGSCQRIDALSEPLFLQHQASTHGLSISEAVALAKNLDELPSKLIIYAINGDQYNISSLLSPAVAQGVDQVVQKILQEEDVQACMKKV